MSDSSDHGIFDDKIRPSFRLRETQRYRYRYLNPSQVDLRDGRTFTHSPRNSFKNLYLSSTQAMIRRKEEMEGTTDRRGRSHPPRCTTSREDRQIVRMAVTDRSVSSRTVAQHIESVTHHSVSARTIRRRLQQSGLSARCPLLGLPLTQNHRRLHRQWCDERRIAASQRCWEPVVLPYLQGFATAIFQQDNARPHVARIVQRFFVNHQNELPPWPARFPDLSSIENMWSMVAQ
ncbi:transposable element Tcb1 transposase [Trichonephila clavipes]|nr:transposable element Tcb1 transposase [Trichonephila clavipes]